MFTMKHKEISGVEFTMAVQKLAGAPMNVQAAYRVKKLVDKVNQAKKKVSELYMETIAKKYGKLDDKGNVVTDDNTPHGFAVNDLHTTEDVQKALTDFHEQTVTVEREPLSLTDLNAVQLSPAEVQALGPCLKDPEETTSETPDNVVKLG